MNLSKAMQQRQSWGSGGSFVVLKKMCFSAAHLRSCRSRFTSQASPAVWHSLGGAGVWPFTFWLLPRPRSWFLNRSCSLKFTAIVLKPHSFRLLTWEDGPGSDRCPNASGKFEKYCFGFATGQPPGSSQERLSGSYIYTHTTLSTAAGVFSVMWIFCRKLCEAFQWMQLHVWCGCSLVWLLASFKKKKILS